MNDLKKLEKELIEIIEAEKNIFSNSTKQKGGLTNNDVENMQRLKSRKILLERKVALLKGEETAVGCKWDVLWDTGAPLPHIVSNGNKVFLIYYIGEHNPDWDGTTCKVIDPAQEIIRPLALVEFKQCVNFKFGSPNDEVFSGMSLYGKGLEYYKAHIIENSKWIKEIKNINKVHPYFKEETWLKYKHFLLLFHDEIFECIAESYNIEVLNLSFDNVLKLACERVIK